MATPAQQVGGSSERMAAFLATLDITPFQKELLRERWLAQVAWLSRQARHCRRRYLALRLPVVLGGVAVPALVTLVLSASQPSGTVAWLPFLSGNDLRLLTFGVSLLVALLAGAEELYHYGDRWRHYRRAAELLKSLGWQYLMLNGAFRRYDTHAAGFTAFTERVEDLLNEDVEGYLGNVAVDSSERPRHEIVA
jgi:hypothetical protein